MGRPLAGVAVSSPSDFFTQVRLGNVRGFEARSMRARNPDMGMGGTLNTIWDSQGVVTLLTADTTLYLSSSSVVDVGDDFLIVGMTNDFVDKVDTATVNGQNGVDIGDWRFVFSVQGLGAAAAVGDVYVGTDSAPPGGVPALADRQARIIAGKQITHSGIFAVPAGKWLASASLPILTGKDDDATVFLIVIPDGIAPLDVSDLDLFQTAIDIRTITAPTLPEKTIILFNAEATKNSARVSATLDFMLVDDAEVNL